MRLAHKIIILIFLSLNPLFGYAMQWQLNPQNSVITFTATQNNAPVKGHFGTIKGEINFDPEHLDASTVNISVETNSIVFSYPPITEALKTALWLDVANFPVATFKASSLTNVGGNKYQANGLLMIKGKSLPIEINFTIEKPLEDKMVAKGELIIQRLIFGIGQGDWADTNEVKNEVSVDFNLTLEQKTPEPNKDSDKGV